MSNNATSAAIAPKKALQRNLGLDLFRLIGVFIVMTGHYAMFVGYAPITGLGDFFKSPLFWNAIDYAIVPVFLMISGYFSLTRPLTPEEDVKKTHKSFGRIFRLYVFWATVSILISFIVGSLTDTYTVQDSYFIDFIRIFTSPAQSLPDGFFINAQLWYLWIFAGLILVTPLFRGFFANASIKLVRRMMVLMFIGFAVLPAVSMLANSILIDVTWFNRMFADTTFFDLGRYGNSMLYLYLLGAWFRVDPAAQKFVDKTPMAIFAVLLAIGSVVMVGHNAISIMLWMQAPSANYSITAAAYDSMLIIPVGLVLFAFFRKLDGRIKQESKFGKFVTNHASKSLIIYVIHIPVLDIMLRTLGYGKNWMGMASSSVLDGILVSSNPYLSCINHTLFGIVMFVIMFALAELLQRIPFMKKFI